MTTPNLDMMELILQSVNVKINVDPTQGITTAEQHKYYSQLGIPWREGLNIVNGDLTVQRSFSELEFPTNTPIWVEEIDLGREDEITGGRYFYKVTTNFYENSYTSSSGFYKWDYKKHIYLLEKWFYNTPDNEITWQPIRPILNFPYTIKFNPGKALGVSIHSSIPVRVNNRDVKELKVSPITVPELEITLLEELPNSLVIKLYGLREVVSMKRFHPINESIEDRTTLIHPLNKEYLDRLLPPNKTFNSQFWNDPLKEGREEVLVERPILHQDLIHGFIEEDA